MFRLAASAFSYVPRKIHHAHSHFLGSESTGHTSYILAEVESSDNGINPHGTNMLTSADCRRSIRLEFFLGNAAARDESLWKIHALTNILLAFRTALEQEIELIQKPKRRESRRRRT